MIISNFIFYFWRIKTLPTHNMLFTEMYLQLGVKPVDLFLKAQKMQNYWVSDPGNSFCLLKQS